MANKSRIDESRVPGGHIALPWSVVDSVAYRNLSYTGKALLIELARQYVRDNNGRLLLSQRYLAGRGWTSGDVILRAKRELLAAQLIYQTVQGHRPNKASWFALTWYTLDRLPGYDDGAVQGFRRGMYATAPLSAPKPTHEELFEKWRDAGSVSPNNPGSKKILTPAHGVEEAAIAPAYGVDRDSVAPAHGAIRGVSGTLSTPAHGDHLEMPSIAVAPGILLAPAQATATTAQTLVNDPDHAGDQIERLRDHDLDPKWYDPITGEFCPPEPTPLRHQKLAANRWVESALADKTKGGI